MAVAVPGRADNDHAVLLDKRGDAVYNTTGNCVRTIWQNQGDPCAPQAAPAVAPKPVVTVGSAATPTAHQAHRHFRCRTYGLFSIQQSRFDRRSQGAARYARRNAEIRERYSGSPRRRRRRPHRQQ